MIVGMDHIAFSVPDIEEAVSEVASWGYRPAFIEKGVLNHRAKIPFLREWREKHDIAYCQSKVGDGLAIELTAHTVIPLGLGMTSAPYQVRFSTTWPRVINTILLETSDLERSIVFWSKLGFCEIPRSRGDLGMTKDPGGDVGTTRDLCFTTPVANKKLYLRLVHTPNIQRRRYYLDDSGFPCLALLTTHIERDRLLFGDTASDVFSLIIHRRPLDICLGHGPDGECVELIAVKKGL